MVFLASEGYWCVPQQGVKLDGLVAVATKEMRAAYAQV